MQVDTLISYLQKNNNPALAEGTPQIWRGAKGNIRHDSYLLDPAPQSGKKQQCQPAVWPATGTSSPSTGYENRKIHVDLAVPKLFFFTRCHQKQCQMWLLSSQICTHINSDAALFHSDWHKFIFSSWCPHFPGAYHVYHQGTTIWWHCMWPKQNNVLVIQSKYHSTSILEWPGTLAWH